MISFKESVQIKTTEKLANECFFIMLNHNINPESLVEWFDTHSEADDISKKAVNWIKTEIHLNEQDCCKKLAVIFKI